MTKKKELQARLEALEKWAINAADALGIDPPLGLKPPRLDIPAAKKADSNVTDFVRPQTDFRDFEEAFAQKIRPWDNPQIGGRCETIAIGGKFLR